MFGAMPVSSFGPRSDIALRTGQTSARSVRAGVKNRHRHRPKNNLISLDASCDVLNECFEKEFAKWLGRVYPGKSTQELNDMRAGDIAISTFHKKITAYKRLNSIIQQ